MPKIIFKCPYLKRGSASHKENMVEYIAIRNGVQKTELKNKNNPATKKQEQFIAQLLKKFPESNNLFEYADFIQNKSIGNASEFIEATLEHNLDVVAKKENYVDYIANRPRVQKLASHGLFNGSGEEIVLSKVAKEVAEHDGNVWLPIISLRREDATNTGFDNVERWQSFLSFYAQTLAENFKIPFDDFRWYASFHDEGHHPHIHMICYSESGRYGYLNQNGIRNIKSGLVSNIFEVEMKEIYAQQTLRRDALKAESKKVVEELLFNIANGEIQNSNLEDMIRTLSEKLKTTKGKRVYGYLPPRMKERVDAITDEIAKEPSVAKAYDLWWELQNKVVHNYSDQEIRKLPLSKQKEFKSIKNFIISEADKLSRGEMSFSEIDASENFIKELSLEDKALYFSVQKIEKLQVWAEKGSDVAQFRLGKIFLTGEKVEKDIDKAIDYFTQSAKQGNAFSQYTLGKLYLMGVDVAKDKEEAKKWFARSAQQGNTYAQFFLDHMDKWKDPSVAFFVSKLMHHLGRILEDNQPVLRSGVGMRVDSKRLKQLREKKMAQGKKLDDFEQKANY